MYNLGAVMVIHLLFYNHVIFSGASFLTDQVISKNRETIFEKFFPEYKVRMEKSGVRDLVVLAKSEEQLRLREPLLEDVPHSFGTDAAKLCSAKWITHNTVIVVFLDYLKGSRQKRKIKDLLICKTHLVHLIFESDSAINFGDVDAVLKIFATDNNKSPLFIHGNDKDNSVKVYGRVTAKDCSIATRLITNWRSGDDIKKLAVLFEPVPSASCSLIVATVHNPPWMVLEEHATDGVRIKSGYEGKIILELAKNFNYTVTVQNFKSDHGTHDLTETIISSCATGKSDICIGQLRPTRSVYERVDVSPAYSQKSLVWCVPRITTFRRDPLVFEFSWKVWMSIGIMFLGSFAIEWIVRNRLHPHRGVVIRHNSSVRIILDIVELTLGNPIVYKPLSAGRKALLVIYICYSLVMTTAYKTSLSSMFTAGNLKSTIIDVEGIIEANLTTGGYPSGLAILKDQRNESQWTPELIKRYVIERNISKALRRVSEDQDFALLISTRDLEYHEVLFEKSGEQIRFDVIDDYVLSHGLVAVFSRTSAGQLMKNFRRSVDALSSNGLLVSRSRRIEFGRMKRSDHLTKNLGMIDPKEELRLTTRETVFYIFITYLLIMGISILVFLGELIVDKSRSTRRDRRLNNLKLFKISRRLPLRSASRRSD